MNPVTKLNELVRVKTLENHPVFSTEVDTYLKWLPISSIFIVDALKVNTTNDWKKQALITGASFCLLNAIVQPLKKMTHEVRPNWSTKENSFPSSHTATCFLGAELLHQELKHNYPIASTIGYGISTATGVLRILKNKHWLTDVLAGAFLGVAVGKAMYSIVKRQRSKGKDQSVD